MKRNNNILVTGASGFVGRALSKSLISSGYGLKAIMRSKQFFLEKPAKNFVINEGCPNLGLLDAMHNVDIVVHLAARVHVMQETDSDPLTAFRKTNVELTKKLMALAIKSKVKRFIFISSLHVNGPESFARPFEQKDAPSPQSPYAISKLEAEQYLNSVAKKNDIDLVIIRPPLVYGPAVRANFLSLLKLTRTGLPLPFGMLHSKRSIVSLNNLVDFIVCCIKHPGTINKTFFVSDDADISTRELCSKLIALFGKHALLMPVPPKFLSIFGSLVRRKEIVSRLCSPLQVNIDNAKNSLNWRPVETLEDALRETVEWYKKEHL